MFEFTTHTYMYSLTNTYFTFFFSISFLSAVVCHCVIYISHNTYVCVLCVLACMQCGNMEAIEKRLKELDVKYIKRTVKDDQSGNAIDQMFFDDPDGFMIEICNCENFKLVQ